MAVVMHRLACLGRGIPWIDKAIVVNQFEETYLSKVTGVIKVSSVMADSHESCIRTNLTPINAQILDHGIWLQSRCGMWYSIF